MQACTECQVVAIGTGTKCLSAQKRTCQVTHWPASPATACVAELNRDACNFALVPVLCKAVFTRLSNQMQHPTIVQHNQDRAWKHGCREISSMTHMPRSLQGELSKCGYMASWMQLFSRYACAACASCILVHEMILADSTGLLHEHMSVVTNCASPFSAWQATCKLSVSFFPAHLALRLYPTKGNNFGKTQSQSALLTSDMLKTAEAHGWQ